MNRSALEGLLDSIEKIDSSAHADSIEPSAPPPEPGRLYRFWRDAWGMDVEPQPHAIMANFVDNALGDRMFKSGGRKLIMVGVPRGTYKTTGYSEATPVEVLTRNPNAKILLDGFAHRVSKARNRAIRRKLERDQVLDDLYGTRAWKPGFREDVWNDEEIFITPRTDTRSREASIATSGVDRSMNSQHFDLIICDDIVTDTNVRTADARENVYQHIQDQLPILSDNGVLLLVFTFWHVDDAHMRIVQMDEERRLRGETERWEKMICGAYDGPNGLFAPSILSFEKLEALKIDQGSRKFAAQFLLKPIADEDRTFDMGLAVKKRFSFYTVFGRATGGVLRVDDREQIDVETTMAWDTAGRKQSKTSDYHGITVVGADDRDLWWFLEALAIKQPPTVVIDRVCRFVETYKPHTLSIEDSGVWMNLLQEELERRSLSVNIVEFLTGGVPKNERIVGLQPRWERRGLILRLNYQGILMHQTFYNQFSNFSVGRTMDHEDIIDSAVQHRGITRKPLSRSVQLDDNPVDPEYAAFLKRKELESAPTRSRAGRFGSTWVVG